MRTSYPTPSFSDQYTFKIVDSTFIHAVHLAKSKGSWNYCLGVTMQDDQNTIFWYIVKDPVAIYNRLTDPKKSPGFTFNNSVKGKQYTKQTVVDKPYIAPKPLSSYLGELPKIDPETEKDARTLIEAYWSKKAKEEEKAPVPAPKAEPLVSWTAQQVVPPKPKVIQFESGYGPLLDTCQNINSTCIAFLGLGYNRAGKGLVIYYALKSKPQDVIAVETDDAGLYREWTQSHSLGQYYNRHIKGLTAVKLKSRV